MKKTIFFNRIKLFFKAHNYLLYIIIFLIAFFLFGFLQSSPAFADPDSYYHAKMAVLMGDQGVVKDFPWLQFTTLKDGYTDHHFLYHFFLIPFVKIFDPFIGTKIATIFFASLVIVFLYWFLKKFKIKYALLYTLIALITMPFVFRINLAKVPALSIIVLIVGLYLIFKHRHWLLFILSFFYVWLYGGFPLIVGLVGFYMIGQSVASFIDYRFVQKNRRTKIRYISFVFKKLFSSSNLKLLAASLGGIILGVVLSPYFPQNLHFYWQQTVKIGVLNYQSIIGVGAEWYPYNFTDLIGGNAFVFMIWLVGLVLFLVKNKKQTAKSWTLFFLSLFFFVFTLKSRRNIEYFVPLTILFSAFAISEALPKIKLLNFRQKIKKRYFKGLIVFLMIYLLFVVSFVSIRDIIDTKEALKGFSSDQFKDASQWLIENSSEGDIVFHSDWDEFPLLFYHNTKNYYIVGLDPTFMYEYDQDLYWYWVHITIGRTNQNLYKTIKETFGASYVFIDKEGHEEMIRNIDMSEGFEKVYEDGEAVIFKL